MTVGLEPLCLTHVRYCCLEPLLTISSLPNIPTFLLYGTSSMTARRNGKTRSITLPRPLWTYLVSAIFAFIHPSDLSLGNLNLVWDSYLLRWQFYSMISQKTMLSAIAQDFREGSNDTYLLLRYYTLSF